MICFSVLLFAFLIPLAQSKKLHEHMSNNEIMEVFQITNNSEVPKYELVQLKHKIDKRTLSQVVEIEFSSQTKTLFLNPTEGFLAGKNTKVWIAKPEEIRWDGFYSYDLEFKLIPNIMEDVGEFFHDLNNEAAIRMRRDTSGHTFLDGTFGSNHMIRSIPERLRNNHTIIPCNFLPSEVDENNFTTTYHHIIYKMSNTEKEQYQEPFYPVPIISLSPPKEDYFEPPKVVYPEILVVVDEAFFSKFKGNVKNAVSYLLTFWNAVDLRFRVLDSPKVRLNIAGIVLVEGPLTFSKAYWERNGEGRYTMNFLLPETGFYFNQGWASLNNATFDMVVFTTGKVMSGRFLKYTPWYDFFTCGNKLLKCLFFKKIWYDLLTENGENLRKDEGAAYLKGACNFSHHIAVGAFRDNGGFQGLTAGAHEVAHLLGAPHDDVFSDEDCAWKLGYMMSYVNGSERRVRLNRCSQKHIRDFLNSAKALCLRNPPPKDESIPKVLPGKYISLDEQCRIKTGYPACNYGPKNCVQLHCFEIKANKKVCSAFEPAAEGSSCGSNKYCLNAECIDESADTVPSLFTYLK